MRLTALQGLGLKQATEPIGKDNDRYILETVKRSDRVILYSLGITKKGCPRHLLYLRSNTQPQMFNPTAFGRNLTVTNNAIALC